MELLKLLVVMRDLSEGQARHAGAKSGPPQNKDGGPHVDCCHVRTHSLVLKWFSGFLSLAAKQYLTDASSLS